jgi:hypothetical protein
MVPPVGVGGVACAIPSSRTFSRPAVCCLARATYIFPRLLTFLSDIPLTHPRLRAASAAEQPVSLAEHLFRVVEFEDGEAPVV